VPYKRKPSRRERLGRIRKYSPKKRETRVLEAKVRKMLRDLHKDFRQIKSTVKSTDSKEADTGENA
jgi:hypothetical protein